MSFRLTSARRVLQLSSLWALWLLGTFTWAALLLSLLLGRTTPTTVSRWWLIGLTSILVVSFLIRFSFVKILRRVMGEASTLLGVHWRTALTDLPLVWTMPVLALVYLSDNFNHFLRAHPLLVWVAAALPVGAAIIAHEAALKLSVLHRTGKTVRIPALNPHARLVLQELLPIAQLIGVAVIFFWPIFTGQVPIPADLLPYAPPWGGLLTNGPPAVNNPVGSDALWLAYPYSHFRHQAAESTLFPLWNPYVFSGTPFLAESTNSQLLQPLQMLSAILPPNLAVSLVAPIYVALAGISMYAFLRVIAQPRGAALIGGITFMLAAVATWWLLLSYMLASVVWLLPLALTGTEFILRGKYRLGILLVSASLSLALLGHTQIAAYTILAACSYLTWMLASLWLRQSLELRETINCVLALVVSVVLALLLAAAQILPSVELAQLSHRAAVTDQTSVVPVPFQRLLTLLLPGIFGYHPDGTSWSPPDRFLTAIYLGILPLTLAVWATISRPNRYIAWGAALTLTALLMAYVSPISQFLFAVFPPFQLFPGLSRYLLLAKFGVALLAAFGAAALLKNARLCPHFLLMFFTFAIVLSLLGSAFAFVTQEWLHLTEASSSIAFAAMRDSLRWLAAMALASAGTLLLVRRWGKNIPKTSVILLGAVTVLDLAGFAGPLYTYASSDAVFPSTPITSYLQQQQSERIFRIVGVPHTTFLPNAAMVYGLADVRGYNGLYPSRVLQFAQLTNGNESLTAPMAAGREAEIYIDAHKVSYDTLHDMRLLSLLNVEYILLDKQYKPSPPLDLSGLEYVMEQPGLRGGTLYRNPNVLTRAFLVGMSETVPDSTAAAKRLKDPQFDPTRQVVLENLTELNSHLTPKASTVEFVFYEPERVRIRVESDESAWLILSDTFYPGWQATVNGQTTPIYPANLLFRAVNVPSGSSIVEFTYQPASWRWGKRISMAALVCWLAVLLYPIRTNFAARLKSK